MAADAMAYRRRARWREDIAEPLENIAEPERVNGPFIPAPRDLGAQGSNSGKPEAHADPVVVLHAVEIPQVLAIERDFPGVVKDRPGHEVVQDVAVLGLEDQRIPIAKPLVRIGANR